MPVFDPSSLIWAVAAVATGGVILRPWRVPEYVWAVGAAVLLTAFGLVPLPTGLGAVAEGGEGLSKAGFDAVHVVDHGLMTASDASISRLQYKTIK